MDTVTTIDVQEVVEPDDSKLEVVVTENVLVEEVSIDGMCGVY